MTNPFHLSIGVKSIDGHQITMKPNTTISADLPDFHFGFNMSLKEFDKIAERVTEAYGQFVHMKPKVVDAGTLLERKKMYLQCPSGYLVELKGYR